MCNDVVLTIATISNIAVSLSYHFERKISDNPDDEFRKTEITDNIFPMVLCAKSA